MLTEDDARNLLAQAADTIPVGDGRPLPVRRHRRWVVPAAAAAVVALVATLGVVLGRGREAGIVDPAKQAPVEREHIYPGGEVPAVLGYTGDEARKVLEERGLVVRVQRMLSCLEDGVALSVEPVPGTQVRPGQRVTLRVADPALADCDVRIRDAWALVRFARGLEASPGLAREVTLVGPDGATDVRSRELLQDRANWSICEKGGCPRVHSLTGSLAQMATVPRRRPMQLWKLPRFDRDPEGGSLSIGMIDEAAEGFFAGETTLVVDYDDVGRIVRVEMPPPPAPSDDTTEPTEVRHLSAQSFVEWGRGQASTPVFADEVQLLWRDELERTVPGKELRRSTWSACSGLGPDECPASFVDMGPRPVTITSRRDGRSGFCTEPAGRLPWDLREKLEDLVELGYPEVRDCADAKVIELWIDGKGAVYAVNLKVVDALGG